MSLEAAIGRIDQILQLREQILDPAAALATAGTGSTTGGSAAGASSFASMLTAAQGNALSGNTTSDGLTGSSELTGLADPISSGVTDSLASLDTTGTTGVTPTTGVTGAADGAAPAAVQEMTSKANALVGKPYMWGGGHDNFGPQAGYDCSGFVSAVLHAGGYLSAPQDTQTLPDQAGIESGPGQYVTIYDRTDAGSGEDHVIIDIAGQFYESGGGHGAWGGGGGVEKIGRPSASYLASFNRILHPAGL